MIELRICGAAAAGAHQSGRRAGEVFVAERAGLVCRSCGQKNISTFVNSAAGVWSEAIGIPSAGVVLSGESQPISVVIEVERQKRKLRESDLVEKIVSHNPVR